MLLWFIFIYCAALLSPHSPVNAAGGEQSSCGEYFGEFPKQSRRTNKTESQPNDLTVTLALLLPNNSETNEGCSNCYLQPVLPVFELAIERAEEMLNDFMVESGRPGEITFRRIFGDTQCSSTVGPLVAVDMVTNSRPDVFIGLICKYVLAPISRYSGVWGIPVLTIGGLSEAFNLKDPHYPTLTRMMGTYGHTSMVLNAFLKEFDWRRIGLIYHNHNEKSGRGHSNCHNSLSAIFRMVNHSAHHQSFDETSATEADYAGMLRVIQGKARIVILCGNATTIREMMLAAESLQMVSSGEYVFFNIELYSSMSEASARPWFVDTDTDERNERAREAFSALLTVTTKAPNQSEYLTFSDEVKALAKEKYDFSFNPDEPISIFVAAFYDSVLLYAHALKDYIELVPNALEMPLNGTRITELMWNRTIHGVTGDISMTEDGDRVADYSLLDMDPQTGKFVVVANYIHNRGIEYVEHQKIHWSGGRDQPPADQPVCGFDGSLCPDKSLPGYAILSLFLGGTMLVFVILFAIAYRRYKLETAINSMVWKVNWDDVLPCNPSSNHRGSVYSMGRRGSQVTLYSEDIAGSLPGDKQLYIDVGFYKGNKVAIKEINHMNIVLDRKQMLELKQMKDLQNEHLVRFYGASVDPPNCYLLTEYCPKGSLQDILENDQIKLDWMFKLSLMHDIIRGMYYLHNSVIGSHGSLKSSNCVVDSRFVLKITDFGLYGLRRNRNEDKESYAYWKNLLWTAPELLNTPYPPERGTQKGDVYSFAIICHEIVTRQGPFYLGFSDDLSPCEIIEKVRQGPLTTGGPSFRPAIDDCTIDDIRVLMEICWSDCPIERPDFRALKCSIRKINKENESGNILDNLLTRMEQYAINLESLVDERTRDYLEEKKKCEDVLYQLLPKSVAAQLIQGKPVLAETYDLVTIYFSDIVGFTRISAESTPLQVVDFLNDLYTCFDSIVGNYDVYKVETIGDAYMVVSGLPVRNGIKHAKEIAGLSLALLNAVHTFRIRHRPDEQLKLRIGLHSGPCVAGVIGLKMPRYCLFGDTVNTASRMESNGEALKIHLSETTKQLLDTFGTFDLKERGALDIKGKGKMTTYWLMGEKPAAVVDPIECDKNHQSSVSTVHQKSPVHMCRNGLVLHGSNNNVNNIVNKNLMRNDRHLPMSLSHSYLLKDLDREKGSANSIRSSLLCEAVLKNKNKKVQMAVDDNYIQATTPLISPT